MELDAFSPTQIREIFVESLNKFINEDLYKSFVKESYIKMKVLEALQDKIKAVTKKVTGLVIDDLEMKDFDINEFAKKGDYSLSIEELCEDGQDDIIETATNLHIKSV